MKHATIIQFRNLPWELIPEKWKLIPPSPKKTGYGVCSHFTQNDLDLKPPHMYNPRGTPIQGMLVGSNEILKHTQKSQQISME